MGLFKKIRNGIQKRRDRRHERKMSRIESRERVKLARVDSKTNRTALRSSAKMVAYQNGIDPNQSMWQGISSLGQSAMKGFSSVLGKGKDPTGAAYGNRGVDDDGNLMLYAGLGLLLMFDA